MTTKEKVKLLAKIGAAATVLVVPFVMNYEGLRQYSYRDAGYRIITSCYGHTGPELRLGQAFTMDECKEMLYADLAKHADDLSCIKQQLSDHQKAAILSFTFNVGRANMCGSTLVRKINAGDIVGGCNELTRWDFAAGKRLPGLTKRREAERQMCLKGLV